MNIRDSQNSILAIVLFIVVLFVLYMDVLDGGFLIGWDDGEQILNNPDVKSLTWENFKNFFSNYYLASYQPLASLSFAIEYYLFGANATVYHLTNLVLYLHNVVLLFLLLGQWFPKRRWLIYFVTLVFALQPFQVEVVAWISTRSTLLSFGFLFWAIYFYNKRAKQQGSYFFVRNYLAVFFLFLLACFSKSSAIVLTPFLFLIDWHYRTLGYSRIIEKLPFLIVSFVFGIVSIDSREADVTLGEFYGSYDFLEHFLIRGKTLYFYMIEWFYTDALHIIRPFPTDFGFNSDALAVPPHYVSQTVIAAAVLIGLIVWIFKSHDKEGKRGVIFGLGLFFIFIGLNLNFFAISINMLAERYNYMPSVGIAIVIYFVVLSKERATIVRIIFAFVVAAGLVRFALVSHNQIKHWKSTDSLFVHNAQHSHNSFSMNMLGQLLYANKDYLQALDWYQRSVALNPNNLESYVGRGMSWIAIGDNNNAINDFNTVLEASSAGAKIKKAGLSQTYFGMGRAYEKENRKLAITYYDSAVNIGNAEAYLKKKKLLKTLPDTAEEQLPILELAAEALGTKNFAQLKYYAYVLKANNVTEVLGLKYAIHAHIGLQEYEEARNLSILLLDKVSGNEQAEVYKFIEDINRLLIIN